MKNIKLIKAKGKGWFLEVEGLTVNQRIALTSEEAWAIYKTIVDNMDTVLREIKK